MSIFEFIDYRLFLRDRLNRFPKRGRGKMQELAALLRIHPSVVSQVFAGKRDFDDEQAIEAAEFFELAPIEVKYFRLLVQLANAGTTKLKLAIREEIQEVKSAAKALSTRVSAERTLSDTERAIFYSSWLYQACRLYCSTHANGRSADEVANRFAISRPRAMEILDFLSRSGLCVQSGDRYVLAQVATFVERGSPFLAKHHSNWRIKAIEGIENLGADELMFTAPVSLSRADFEKLRERMADFIKELSDTVKKSSAEDVACFNMDFFWVKR